MSMQDINSALTQAYIDAGLGLPTAYEGVVFDPSGVTDWAGVTIIPAINEPVTLGIGGEDQEDGIMQIDLMTESGKGTDRLLKWADILQLFFVAGKGFTYNSTLVLINSMQRTGVITDGGWLKLSVSINWYSRFDRPSI